MTATIVENELDTDITELVDWNSQIPCDSPECDDPAEYQARTACCGDLMLICGECLIVSKEYLRSLRNKEIRCKVCGWQGPCTPDWIVVIGRLDGN